MRPVCESEGYPERVVDTGDAGGLLDSRPEAEAVVEELSVADAERDVAAGPELPGHRDVDPDLEADVSHLGQCAETEQTCGYGEDYFHFYSITYDATTSP